MPQVSFKDILKAKVVLKGYANKTPVITSRTVNSIYECEVFFKCENFQRVGAFKFRGAFNALSNLSNEQKKNGVVAYSSGNHAQAIALAGKLLNIPTTIVMPHDAPQVKIEATKGYGGNVIIYDRFTEDRVQIGQKIANERGCVVIPPYDHPHIIAGQGTAALELHNEIPSLDYLFVPLGGGGLLSGSCLSTKELAPKCKIYGVEPEAGNDGQQSLKKGKIVKIETPKTIADGAQTMFLGEHTFPIIKRDVEDIITVSDDELIEKMTFTAARMKMIVEPTACLGFAGLNKLKDEIKGKRVGVLISGGNIDITAFANFILGNR